MSFFLAIANCEQRIYESCVRIGLLTWRIDPPRGLQTRRGFGVYHEGEGDKNNSIVFMICEIIKQ
jgi:hypothetical protein